MRVEIEVPDYSPGKGLRLAWSDDAEITVQSGAPLTIRANAAGLESLARHLLTLAQAGVPAGHHLHLDESNGLEDDSAPLIIEKV